MVYLQRARVKVGVMALWPIPNFRCRSLAQNHSKTMQPCLRPRSILLCGHDITSSRRVRVPHTNSVRQ